MQNEKALRIAAALVAFAALAACAPASYAGPAGHAGLLPAAAPYAGFANRARAKTLYIAASVLEHGQLTGVIDEVPAASTGTVVPKELIGGSKTGLHRPFFIALDEAGRLWATNCTQTKGSTGPVVTFGAGSKGNAVPQLTLGGSKTTLTACQTGIALDPSGAVYVSDENTSPHYPGGHVAIGRAGATGNVAPSRTIGGSKTGIHSPAGVAVDAKGEVYVADSCQLYTCPGDVRVFAAAANGNVAPLRVISTGVSQPQGLAFDSHGNLYVANAGNSSVAVYAPGASKPARTITGAGTGAIVFPTGVAVDPSGYLYVGNDDQFYTTYYPVQIFAPGAGKGSKPVGSITLKVPEITQPSGVAVR